MLLLDTNPYNHNDTVNYASADMYRGSANIWSLRQEANPVSVS